MFFTSFILQIYNKIIKLQNVLLWFYTKTMSGFYAPSYKSESNSTQENANQEQFNQAADTNETTTSVTESSQDMDDDLPF